MRRVEVTYEGRVQGVGFRFTAQALAARLPVTGYVQNQVNGTVKLVAEGARTDLDALLMEIQASHLGGGIRHAPAHWSPPTGEFSGFEIRH